MATAPQHAKISAFGRPVAEAARRIGVHPSALIRWCRRGRRLSDGSTARLKMTASPGGWFCRDEDVADFLERLTADRVGSPGADPRPAARTPIRVARAATADAELIAAGS